MSCLQSSRYYLWESYCIVITNIIIIIIITLIIINLIRSSRLEGAGFMDKLTIMAKYPLLKQTYRRNNLLLTV